MCAINPLIKFMFDAWKLNVKNVTNEHRINGVLMRFSFCKIPLPSNIGKK
jgi:hypothetical protein